ncbi:hypothetical protein B0I35DRAFT_485023 [Stachybotrys elegans]|uniref:Uncharacterized protein n=1 Tax=Stachybotrys elegans TaxID=80388 RepID=A0A8K0SDI0_9HYPO|nr:hypothetical protein B0I35DRAFT_485023 [Stachybotrys elegans]
MLPASSAYAASKLVLCKVVENLATEHPDVFVAAVHPGMVETVVFTKGGAKADTLRSNSQHTFLYGYPVPSRP